MTSPIDPIRRSQPARKVRASEPSGAQHAVDYDERALPVPLETEAEAAPPPQGARRAAGAEFAAQILGQDGQKRGLRGGPAVLDAAKSTYTRVEWSGAADRRAKAGRSAKTEI
jgi:hypothetical protein